MGHLTTIMIVDKREDIEYEASEFAHCNVDRNENWNGSYHGNLTIHDNIICATVEEAEKKIKSLDNGWYDDHAVQFYDIPAFKPTKKMERLLDRVADNQKKRQEYEDKHRIQNLKSRLITCDHCGSKIAKNHIRGQRCPVCNQQDLRANYITERLAKFDQDREDLLSEHQRLEIEAKEKQAKKYRGKAPIKWLAKFEVHI